MTAERVKAMQNPGGRNTPVTAVPVTVATVDTHTVTVTFPGGGTATAPRGAGWAYTPGGPGWALIQEPAVIAVFPTA